MLFACIHIPDFSVQAALLVGDEPQASFKDHAVALLDGPESLLKIFACNERARQAGIEIGMTKLQAEACPAVVLRKRVVEQEESAQAALLDCVYSFSPCVESTCGGTVIADLTGAERLLGSPQEIGKQLAARAEEVGFTANVALAANADTALHAARGFAGISVIAEGLEALRLASLPVEVLEPSPEMLDTLDSWGIRNFKALAALPSVPLTQRLGQQGLHLQRLARGEVHRELVPAEPPPRFQESMELEEPVDLLEPLGFLLNRLLDELMSRLQARSLATDHVQVDLELEIHPDRQLSVDTPLPTLCARADLRKERASPGVAKDGAPSASPESAKDGAPSSSLHQRALKLPVPMQDAKVLLKLLQLDLAAHPPPAPVKKIIVEVFPARQRLTQAGLFQPLAPEPARLEITLARLRAVVGEKDAKERARVGFPLVTDSHRPDSFQVLPSSSEEAGKANHPSPRKARGAPSQLANIGQAGSPGPGTPEKQARRDQAIAEALPAPQVVLRWFRPPIAARVECGSTAFGERSSRPAPGQPATVFFHGVKAKVIQACGPWRSSGSWWDKSGQWQREEWDVDLAINGASGLYRIFRDFASGEWFVEGMYD
jgi:protein ImuB